VGLYCGSDPGLTGLYTDGTGGTRSKNIGAAGAPPSPQQAIAALESIT
jgi:hypothetical protein